jgi:protein-L-isoaspartate(D-aspartate) O-methyltransferase
MHQPTLTPLDLGHVEEPDQARRYRQELVSLLAREIGDPRTLAAMARVPRHVFVPTVPLRTAYLNQPAPIPHGQMISQPAMVAVMTEALLLIGDERVLEVGTGSGYQSAVLALLAGQVYTVEVIADLEREAHERLLHLGYTNVHTLSKNGHEGWPEEAPFDRILITAAPPSVPPALFHQLKDGGILIAPVGADPMTQRLLRYHKTATATEEEDLGAVRFVPMVR